MSFAPQLFRFEELQMLSLVGQCVVFLITAKHQSWLEMQKKEKWKCRLCQKSETTPPMGWVRAELYSGTMRSNDTWGQNFTYFQNSIMNNYKAWKTKPCIRNSLPALSSLLLAMFLIIYWFNISPSIFFFSWSSPKHPHFALPKTSHHSLPACGTGIR